MEDSYSSGSYSFSDMSLETINDSFCMCTLTKITYNEDTNPVPVSPKIQNFSKLSNRTESEGSSKHLQLGRSLSEPTIRLSDNDESGHGMEPNSDLFGIQLEVGFFIYFFIFILIVDLFLLRVCFRLQ